MKSTSNNRDLFARHGVLAFLFLIGLAFTVHGGVPFMEEPPLSRGYLTYQLPSSPWKPLAPPPSLLEVLVYRETMAIREMEKRQMEIDTLAERIRDISDWVHESSGAESKIPRDPLRWISLQEPGSQIPLSVAVSPWFTISQPVQPQPQPEAGDSSQPSYMPWVKKPVPGSDANVQIPFPYVPNYTPPPQPNSAVIYSTP